MRLVVALKLKKKDMLLEGTRFFLILRVILSYKYLSNMGLTICNKLKETLLAQTYKIFLIFDENPNFIVK